MSDPAKSAPEIEDVLSSIRRLVSETQDAEPSARDPAAARRDADKLVLTPSLRVSDPDDPWSPVPLQAEEAAEPAATDEATWNPDDRLSDWGEIEARDAGPDHVDDAAGDAPGQAQSDDADRPAADAPGAEHRDLSDLNLLKTERADDDAGFESETGDADWSDTVATRALSDLAAARGRGATDQPSEPRTVPDAQSTDMSMADAGDPDAGGGPDAEDNLADTETVARDMTAPQPDDQAAGNDAGDTTEDDNTDDDNAPGDAAGWHDDDSDDDDDDAGERPVDGRFVPIFSRRTDRRPTVEAPEEAEEMSAESGKPGAADEVETDMEQTDTGHTDTGQTDTGQTDAEPVDETDTPDDDRQAGAAPSIERADDDVAPEQADPADHAERLQDAQDVEDLGDSPSPFSFPETEDGILDEDTLREIVSEVVRQELQGALGQRITRNVRKMVRREIRLTLAAEDLE